MFLLIRVRYQLYDFVTVELFNVQVVAAGKVRGLNNVLTAGAVGVHLCIEVCTD
jgi:hypothetical protein